MTFADALASLPTADHVAAIELLDAQGRVERIDNRPGSQGSVRVYAYLLDKHGAIGPEAAHEGLALYAEHGTDARANPGKHPNIDRLIRVAEGAPGYRGRLVPLD
jgi:hypothetical protein